MFLIELKKHFINHTRGWGGDNLSTGVILNMLKHFLIFCLCILRNFRNSIIRNYHMLSYVHEEMDTEGFTFVTKAKKILFY